MGAFVLLNNSPNWIMRRRIAAAAIIVLSLNFAEALPALAKPYRPGGAQKEPAVAGSSFSPPALAPAVTGTPFMPTAPVWPGATQADVKMPDAAAIRHGWDAPVKAGGLPVTLGVAGGVTPGAVRVESFDRTATQAMGVSGIAMRLSRSDGAVGSGKLDVTVDYNAFRWAYGGDWAQRLAVYVDGRRVPSTNDVTKGTVSAPVEVVSGTLVTLDAAPGGPGGDYKASTLSPSATWSAGNNSGDFSWSYPLRMPPAINGPAASVSFAYSSSSVDGRMASANNQASAIGEGFDYNPGYIERRYNACAEDMGSGANNSEKTGDLCWETDNASLAMEGHAGELIKDGTDANRWHLRNGDVTHIEHKTGGPNSDNDGEWWVVTTTDGTRYWFGGRSGSNAVLTVPVFGNNANEPCHATAFADSHCLQAQKWYLDYVVDTDGNTMTVTYAKDTNKYGRNNKREDDTVYDRDGYPVKIEYGTRSGGSGSAPAQVLFSYGDRCFNTCGTKDAIHWPDVPWDQECTADTCNWNQLSPSFWTSKRLTTVKTRVWAGLDYSDVEQWTLSHSFPSSDQPSLWLDKISHAGLVGGSKSVPDVTFVGVAMPNRVDTNSDQYPAMNRYRMKTINSETGGKIDLTYTGPDCVAGTRVPDKNNLQSNVYRCYPVKWQPEGQLNPIDDFFHKYLISDVVEADLSGTSSRVLTHYNYVGDPAWHYTDDDGFIKKDFKTWSVWRGYGAVRTVKGDPGEQSVEEVRYFRGMHGDKLPTGNRNIQLPAIGTGNVPAVNDEDAYSGMVRETIKFNGGAEITGSASEPWQSEARASRTINGFTVTAREASTKTEHTRTALDGGRGFRTTTKVTTFNANGNPVKIEDLGDNGKSGDETCGLTDYVGGSGPKLVDLVSRERTFAVDCAAAVAGGLTDADVTGDVRTYYDQLAFGAAPTKGHVSKVEKLKAYNAGNPTYFTQSAATHDAHGRVKESWDARGARTLTEYTPAVGGPVTETKQTGPLGWTRSTTFEPAWGQARSTSDANGRKVELAYDPLGRLISVWLPGRDKATQPASVVYDYLIRNNAPTVVTTKRLNSTGGYITSYQFYDNLLRARQTQESDGALGVAAVVTDTYYDSAGRSFRTHDPYVAKDAGNNPVAPSTNLFLPTGNIPQLHIKQYDAAGREIATVTKVDGPPASPGGTVTKTTITGYGGDRTHVTPPKGGPSKTTIVDANGNLVEMRHYQAGVPVGSATGFDTTKYEYDRKGALRKVTDPGGNVWQYEYDLAGHMTKQTDPDKGVVETTYSDADDVLTTKDGEGRIIAYTYDLAGRKTSMRDTGATGPKRAEWVYDQLTNGTFVYGHLVKTIRYEGTDQYIKEHTGYTVDYKPTSVKFTVPNNATAAGVNGAYTYVYTYHQDGSPATTRLPGFGDLGLETLTRTYNRLGKPDTLDSSLGGTLVAKPDPNTPGTEYTSYGEVGAVHMRNNAGARVDVVRTYETATRRLAQIWTTKATAPNTIADLRYSYDEAGNVEKISDLAGGDHQCFTIDQMRQLTEAWTPSNGDCQGSPSAAGLGGPAKYWHSYTYDAVGNRTKLVEHATATGDKTTDYTSPAGAHKLASRSTSDGTSASYTYDASGNMLTRPAPGGGTQTLTWDAEGHLTSATDSTGTTTFVYDVDGTRLLRKDPAGKTLYLPGQELRYSNSGQKTCTRYYTHADITIATRSGSGVVWLGGDHHGTAQIAVNAVGQGVSIRRETPFGVLRGATGGAWPSIMDKGFVGGTNDNTGLTHLGAREYDPLIGRFISVDPVIDNKDPQQMHGYTYANNAPVTASDPDGLWPQFLDKAVSKVTNAVNNVANTVVSGVKAAGQWVYDNAGTISTVLSVAAIACSIIPPLQAAAPFLGAAATVVGAIDTYKSCKSGAALDCAMGLTDLVPGGRLVGDLAKGAKNAKNALEGADDLGDAARRKGDDLTCPWPHSFQPTTPVVMGDGSRKAIGAVKVGDQVLATDPLTGKTSRQPVTMLYRNLDRDLTDLTVAVDPNPAVAGDESLETLETTWHHPFWDSTSQAWVDAEHLQPGHRLQGLFPRGTVTVVRVHNFTGSQVMRDLTVAYIHAYYVVAGDTPVLVHNNNYCGKHRAEGDSSQEPGYVPKHGSENVRGHRKPTLFDKVVRGRFGQEAGNFGRGADDFDKTPWPNVFLPAPGGIWWSLGGRALWGLRNWWRERTASSYPGRHRRDESTYAPYRQSTYRGKHFLE